MKDTNVTPFPKEKAEKKDSSLVVLYHLEK